MRYKEIVHELYLNHVNELIIDEKLLSEKALMLKYATSRSIIRRALSEMINYNLINVIKGKGYFVNPSSFIFDEEFDGSFKAEIRNLRVINRHFLVECNNYTNTYFKIEESFIKSLRFEYYTGSFLVMEEMLFLNQNVKPSLEDLKSLIISSEIVLIKGEIRNDLKGVLVLILDFNKAKEILCVRECFLVNNMVTLII